MHVHVHVHRRAPDATLGVTMLHVANDGNRRRDQEENRMGSFSIWHWLIVLVVVVLIFGTKKLRNIGTDLGGAVKGFKDGMKSRGRQGPPNTEIPPFAGQTIDGEVRKETSTPS